MPPFASFVDQTKRFKGLRPSRVVGDKEKKKEEREGEGSLSFGFCSCACRWKPPREPKCSSIFQGDSLRFLSIKL